MKNIWTKKCQDWTGGDLIKFTVILSAVSYGATMIILYWDNICHRFESIGTKIRGFFKPDKEDF